MSSRFQQRTAATAVPPKATNGRGTSPPAPAARGRSQSPVRQGSSVALTPIKAEEEAKVAAWQNEVDSLEQKQMQIQADQMTLLFSQIHILTRELGDLQKQFVAFGQEVKTTQEEAHSALRLELAEHGGNVQELKAAWDEAHNALSDAMDRGLSDLADKHSKALEDHKAENAKVIEDYAAAHGSGLTDLENLHNQRYEEHQADLQAGLEGVHGTLQSELAELRSGHEVNLRGIVTDLTAQVDKITLDMEQMAKDMTAAQEEAHSALRLELAEHGNNAEEMRAAWEEAHQALKLSMDDNLSQLAEDHAKALEAHKAENAAALAEHAENHGGNLTDLETLHNQRFEEHSATLTAGLEDVHGTLQKELAELRSGHAVNLQAVVTELTAQVDKLTLDMEQVNKDVTAAQEEAHASLRLELAEHSNNATEMKAAWEEAHKALSFSMDEALGNLAEEHAQAQGEHSKSHTDRMDEMEKQISAQFDRLHSNHGSLSDMHDSHRFEQAAALEKGMESVLENTHARLQDELAELRSGHAANLSQVIEDVTLQVDTLTLAMENAQVLRKANSEKLEQIFAQMSNAFGSVSFSGKKSKADKNKDKENGAPPTSGKAAKAAPAPAKTTPAAAKSTPAPAASRLTVKK